METVGVNVTHDASFCRCVNGEIDLFIEEERLSRKKHDNMPVKTVMEYQESNFAGVTGLEYNDYSLRDTCNFFDVICLLYTSPSPRDRQKSRMPSSA